MKTASLLGHLVEILSLLERTQEPFDRSVAEFFRKRTYLGARDRRFISSYIYAITRHRRRLEALFERVLEVHAAATPLNQFPHRFLPLYLIYELLEGEGSPEAVPQALWEMTFPGVDKGTFAAAVRQHSDFAFLGDDPVVRRGVNYSFQDWMVAAWTDAFGDDVEALLGALNREAPVTLRVNTTKTTREACRERLASEGVHTEPTAHAPAGLTAAKRFNVHALRSFAEGWFEVQDEGSQIVSLIGRPREGSTVIDGCAGAGGKSLHLADLMRNTGTIVAVDVDPKKLRELRNRAARGGYGNISTVERSGFAADTYRSSADLVLVDAPCSGSGTIRRNPALKWRLAPEDVANYRRRQGALLDEYAICVKPGGVLVYATCSLFGEENEMVVDEFLGKAREFHLPSAEGAFQSFAGMPEQSIYHCYPHRDGTDGFFIAVMKREGDAVASSPDN